MAARIRTLADAVADMTEEIRSTRAVLQRMDLSRLDGRARKAAEGFAYALESFTSELAKTNAHLKDLARRPIMGLLGGGAEAELQRLVARVDALREELRTGVDQLAPR